MSLDKLVRFSWTDDTGSGLDGTIINNTQLQKIFDTVDQSIGQSVKVLGGAYNALPTDDLLKITSGTFIIYVYTAAGYDGRQLDIANVGAGTVTVAGIAGQQIGGFASWPLPPKTSIRIKSDGANWVIMTLSSNTAFKQELTLTAGAFRPWPGGNACGPHEDLNIGGYYTLGIPFSESIVNYAYTQFTLPKAWQRGQITLQFYHAAKASTAGYGVYWGCGIAGMGYGESLGQAATTGAAVQSITTAAGALSYSTEIAVAGGWANVNDLIRLYVYRDPTQAADGKGWPQYLLALKLRLWLEAVNDE